MSIGHFSSIYVNIFPDSVGLPLLSSAEDEWVY